MSKEFIELGIRPALVKRIQSLGITQPTPIQEQAIPILLAGQDIIGQAQTGTGKTLAFVLPILERVDPQKQGVQALIVTPTRELALQITTEIKKLAAEVGAKVLAVYGGQDVAAQVHKLKGATHIVISTPGRLLDHVRRETIDLQTVTMLVLDEADQMLQMGFLPEVEQIISHTSHTRQMMLFSATMPNQIRSLAKRYLQQPAEVKVKSKQVTIDEIEQFVVETTDRLKQEALLTALKQYNPFLGIIFCRTKRRASKLNEALLAAGLQAEELHGDLSQAKRERVMKQFREARIQYLVATDVVARGLDVEGVTHVFNYDIPHDVESYIHRIGRTGRAGESGISITFIAPKDRQYLQLIEKGTKRTMERLELEGFERPKQQTAGHSERRADRRDGPKRSNQRPQEARTRHTGSRTDQRTERTDTSKSTSRNRSRSNRTSTETGSNRRERSGQRGRASHTRTSNRGR